MRQMPLSGRVVFVDWHGVLSQDTFWMSILDRATHPLREELETKLAEMFTHGRTSVEAWMKGRVSAEEVVAALAVRLDRRYHQDFLVRRLYEDCARMQVNVELFETLRKVRSRAMVVLATDNMDCFARTFRKVHDRRRQPSRGSRTLADWAVVCDDLVCSSDVGALKAEDPVAFFGPWLSGHGLDFSDAALIDDRAGSCEAFAAQGGTPIQYAMASSDIGEVAAALDRWLGDVA